MFRKAVRFETNLQIMLQGRDLNRVDSCKYLGVIFSDVLTCDLHIDSATNAFIKQFNGLYCIFNYLERETLAYLFRTYTSSFYGNESWFYNIIKKNIYRIGVAYHKAVKMISFLNIWDSNHLACSNIRPNIFCHVYAKRMITHVFFFIILIG